MLNCDNQFLPNSPSMPGDPDRPCFLLRAHSVWFCCNAAIRKIPSHCAQIPRVGPFLNCNQADTKRPKTVMGTVPSTMPNIRASTVADRFREESMGRSATSMAEAICGAKTAPATGATATPRKLAELLGGATKVWPRRKAAIRLRANAGRMRRAMAQTVTESDGVLYFSEPEIRKITEKIPDPFPENLHWTFSQHHPSTKIPIGEGQATETADWAEAAPRLFLIVSDPGLRNGHQKGVQKQLSFQRNAGTSIRISNTRYTSIKTSKKKLCEY